jgi:hypothetical protein
LRKPGIQANKILSEFSQEQIEGIYPALSPIMVMVLVEELELMGYIELRKGKAQVSMKGEAKLNSFKDSLAKEERKALEI